MTVKVGLTEPHGMAAEIALYPAQGVEYTFLETLRSGSPWLHSPIKGYFSTFDEADVDIIEAILSPIATKKPWFYSLACYQEALAFDLRGFPIPKTLRNIYMKQLFNQSNFKGFLFWSKAGQRTVESYGGSQARSLLAKSHVVYPAIRTIDTADKKKRAQRIASQTDEFQLLFSGDFFRKGGVNVIDAFEALKPRFPGLKLVVCSSEEIDFNTENKALRAEYLHKLKTTKDIAFGRVDRVDMLYKILPATDCYLLPSYNEAFGFAVLEAMAYGIPCITTDIMAFPELIDDTKQGYIIDTGKLDVEKYFRGYVVNDIPAGFRQSVTTQLIARIESLINNKSLQTQMSQSCFERASNDFSFERRNREIKPLYDIAIASSSAQSV